MTDQNHFLHGPLISVVICTYNRAELLKGAIESLLEQNVEPDLFEIIVVDNNSTDLTYSVVKEYLFHSHIRYIFESVQGLGHARNRGYTEAKGKYVAYLDDDARADPDWIKNILFIFNNTKPKPLGIGGPIYPFYDSPKPAWYKDEYEIRSWGNKSRFLDPKESFSGSNMIFTKQLLENLNGFNVNVGVKGDNLSVGEETFLFMKIWNQCDDQVLYYSPLVKIFHYTPQEKMTVIYSLKRSFASGQSTVMMEDSNPISWKKRMKLISFAVIATTYLTLKAIIKFPKYKHYQSWIFEYGTSISGQIGKILALSGLNISVKQYILDSSVIHEDN